MSRFTSSERILLANIRAEHARLGQRTLATMIVVGYGTGKENLKQARVTGLRFRTYSSVYGAIRRLDAKRREAGLAPDIRAAHAVA